ncbi:MAG: NAD(P)/FAD-dependent oxidoreductase, partial [Gammaproteobacteria bacterium]|nr:NAD(P)/FAD-dependent oxidoreductase [Gammaproteobacteria bacterium]
ELYPDKPIYDIPAIPVCGAQELIDRLLEQIKPFSPDFHLGQQVSVVRPLEEGAFDVRTSAGTEFIARTIVVAGGVGSFEPMPLKIEGIDKFRDTFLFYRVTDPAIHHGKNLVVLGGGDSALDWVLNLHDKATRMTLVHRRHDFRAAPASVSNMKALVEQGKMDLFYGNVSGYSEQDGRLREVEIRSIDGETTTIAADHLLVFFGLSPKLGPIADWGLNFNKDKIAVDTETFSTNVPGIFAIGDIVTYPGKKKLILSGFHEAALAAFSVKAHLNPGEKINVQYTTTSSVIHERLGVGSKKKKAG